jgi:hypothetical protein
MPTRLHSAQSLRSQLFLHRYSIVEAAGECVVFAEEVLGALLLSGVYLMSSCCSFTSLNLLCLQVTKNTREVQVSVSSCRVR